MLYTSDAIGTTSTETLEELEPADRTRIERHARYCLRTHPNDIPRCIDNLNSRGTGGYRAAVRLVFAEQWRVMQAQGVHIAKAE